MKNNLSFSKVECYMASSVFIPGKHNIKVIYERSCPRTPSFDKSQVDEKSFD